jgi:uncharacterized protein (TIRG00374 family)
MQPNYQSKNSNNTLQSRQTMRRRLIKPPQPFQESDLVTHTQNDAFSRTAIADRDTQRFAALSPIDTRPYQQLDAELEADFDSNHMSAVRLMQFSGVLQAVHVPVGAPARTFGERPVSAQNTTGQFRPTTAPSAYTPHADFSMEELSQISQSFRVIVPPKPQPGWQVFLNKPVVKVILGIGIGLLMLLLVSRLVNIPQTISVLQTHLTTTQGIIDAILTTLAFMTAFTIRGARWSMFLRPITRVSIFKVIRIYWVGVFINVLLPVQGGEIAKSLMLRSVTGVPVSQSLPTVAMDKSLDLMPALAIMAIVAFIPGIHMNLYLWLILGLVSGILLGVIFVVALTAWNRIVATRLIRMICGLLPKGVGGKIEGFAMGFVDSLLAGVSRPRTFIPAALLTCMAISCDGLFAWFAFKAVGVTNMGYGTAIFGYTVFNMFSIIPSPPGGVGTNEFYGTLVFGQLLGFNKPGILAMFFFSHPLTALIMAITGLACLSSLGLKLSNALKAPTNDSPKPPFNGGQRQASQKQAAMV